MDKTVARRAMIPPAIVVGVFAIGTSILGILYGAISIIGVLSNPEPLPEEVPYFFPTFVIMTAICLFCYLVLLVSGVDLVQSRLRWSRLVKLILLFEVGFFFAIVALWMEPTIGVSVAAATGVTAGGLMAQFVALSDMGTAAALVG